MTVGLRVQKAAKIKVEILKASISLLGKNSFCDLYVDKICERVKISKVTFFKYFPQKDDILLYYLRVWCLDRAIELSKEKKEGLNGIYFLFDRLAETYIRTPGLILNLISYYTSLQRPPSPVPLRAVERAILYPTEPDIDDIEILTVPQLMENFLLEAVFKGEITSTGDTKDLSDLFTTMLYGSIVTAHLRQIQSVRLFLKRNLDSLVNGLR
ncbi:MAG: TetR/AcrR family transcriptional regulator [Bacteroidota bacterium]